MGIRGLFEQPVLFQGQNYEQLKKHHFEVGVPFTDPHFPASDNSIAFSKSIPKSIEWKRPNEICKTPKLLVEGASAGDVTQGQLGNCWFVAASSVLAGVKSLWNQVVPNAKAQEYGPNMNPHPGIFHFRFWRFGEWVEVVVDDLLPTLDGKLLFTHSETHNEFWSALLEKAYAKLNGSYEALDGGNLSDALVDFTSGVSEMIHLREGGYLNDEDKKKELFDQMTKEMEDHALMCCAIAPTSQEEMEARTEVGLVKGHAYGITAVKKVHLGESSVMTFFKGREKINMIRLRNPWGEREWNGAFSDGSKEWSQISEAEREKIGLTFEEDGEFWMTFDDFLEHFTDLSICLLINTSLFSFTKTWDETQVFGRWCTGAKGTSSDRAGGCLNNRDTFLRNPQYAFDVTTSEEEVIIQLSQRDVRDRKQEGAEMLSMGFHIMKVELNRRYRLHSIKEKSASSDYYRTRSIFFRGTLKRGRHVLVPTTFQPEQTGDYLIRIFMGHDPDFHELKKEVPKQSFWPCRSYPIAVTVVKVKCAIGLQKMDRFGSADPYLIIKSDDEVIQSHYMKNTLNPTWDISAVFYRKNLNHPIKLQVWNKNILMDSFMGQAVVMAPPASQPEMMQVNVYGRRREKTLQRPGHLTIEVQTVEDLKGI